MNIYKKQSSKIVVFSFALGLFLNAATAFAATSIGNNITTDGTVTVNAPGQLTINGLLQYTTGAAANLFLKSSDAAGNAVWATELDPVFLLSEAVNFVAGDKLKLDLATQPGDNVSTLTNDAGYLTVETDPFAVLKATFTTAGDLLVGTGAGTYNGLGAGSNGQVLTISAGVPSWQNSVSGFTDPMTTIGDMIYRDGTNTTNRLGIGGAGTVLSSNGANMSWAAETDPVYSAWDKSTGISITESQISDLQAYLTAETDPVYSAWDKSTGISITESQISDLQAYLTVETDPFAVLKATFTTTGDLLVGTGAGTYNALGVGTNGQCLTSNGTTPVWGSCGSGSLPAGTTTNSTLRYDGTNWVENISLLATAAGAVQIGGGTAITKHLSATNTLDFPNLGNACSDLTIPVTGAAVGDTVVATPTPVEGGIETLRMNWNTFVSAANTVTVRACAHTAGQNAESQTWRADVWQH